MPKGSMWGMVYNLAVPWKCGVELLIEGNKDPRFSHTKKLLLSGLDTHQDTINAINNAAVYRYIEKRWNVDSLQKQIWALLTRCLFEHGMGYERYLPYLDKASVLEYVQKMG